MSKKLIALASASALALSALVGIVPATALPVVTSDSGTSFLKVTGTTSGTGTTADPFLDAVPAAGTVASGDIITFTVSSTLKRTAATVAATSGIKLLDAPGDATNKYTAASGSASLSLTTTDSGSLLFYGFATSTTTGIVTLTIGTDITQVSVKGTAGAAYAIKSVTPPSSVTPEGKGTYVAELVDAFGNAAIASGDTLSVTVVGGGSSSFASEGAVNAKVSYSATTKRTAGILTAGKTAGQIAVAFSLDTAEPTDDQIAAFGTPVRSYFGVVTTASAAAQVAALTAQVATLTASVTALTADYNKLANRFNKLYAAKKAPKKKVALK